MRIKQAIEALEVAQDALDISQSLQESAKSNHHPKTLAAYERVSAALAALRSMPQGEPVATIRYERGTPGKENDMPKVVSCNWLPDGVYSVYATPHTAPAEPVDDALNTLCKMLHNGEEVEGDDGLAMLVPMDLWNDAQEAIESLVGEDDATPQPAAKQAQASGYGPKLVPQVHGYGPHVETTTATSAAQAEPVALDGWKLVPVEPTPEMLNEGAQRLVSWGEESKWPDSWDKWRVRAAMNEAERVWRSMWLASSPTQPRLRPLTDEQIMEIAKNPMTAPCSPWWLKDDVVLNDIRTAAKRFARAIEAAHGITAQEPTK